MNQNIDIVALIKGKRVSIVLGSILVAALSFLFLVVSQKNFKVSTDYLIVQNQSGSQDFYTLSKSSQYIGKVLGEGAYSELFIDQVQQTGKVNREFLPFDKKEKLKEWSKTVSVKQNPDLGIITIEVFNNDQRDALAISSAVADVLTTKNSLFLGDGQNVEVKILSGPVLEKNQSVPNIIAAIIGGLLFGCLLTIAWIYYRAFAKPPTLNFGTPGGKIIFHNTTDNGKQRMENSGIFMSEEEYQESLKYLEK